MAGTETRAERVHSAYLARISTGPDAPISPELAARAAGIRAHLERSCGEPCPMPDAAPGPDGELLYIWGGGSRSGGDYVSLEMRPGGAAEWFGRDGRTGRIRGEAWADGEPMPGWVREMIGRSGSESRRQVS